jgi:hypothetical protein
MQYPDQRGTTTMEASIVEDDQGTPGTIRQLTAQQRTARQRVRTQQLRRDVCRAATVDFNLLRAFVRVVDVGSLPEAAADLGYSAPALGQRMKALEQQLGYRLLVHGPAGVRATLRGSQFLPYVKVMLGTVEALRQQGAQGSQDGPPV